VSPVEAAGCRAALEGVGVVTDVLAVDDNLATLDSDDLRRTAWL
jgi:hypothetical protein